MRIEELVNSHAMAAYITEQQVNRIPYFGETLFPAQKKRGLTLEWLKGYKSLPVALMPSAFDAKATVRDRLGVATVMTKMPFFRESMRLGEQERQNLMDLLVMNNNVYVAQAVADIFDDRKALVDGAMVQPERMIMSLLIDGKINIAGPNDKGRNVSYAYDYDPNGDWAANNTETITVAANKWSATATANPIKDILRWKKAMRAKYGVEITRAICNSSVWEYLLNNEAIRKDMNPLGAQYVIFGDADLAAYLSRKVGLTVLVYDKMYKDEEGVDKNFYPDDYFTLLPSHALGKTWYGTTPEEADLMNGGTEAQVSIVNTGVAITTYKEPHPVNIVTLVSEIVLPSFENMSDIFTAKVA